MRQVRPIRRMLKALGTTIMTLAVLGGVAYGGFRAADKAHIVPHAKAVRLSMACDGLRLLLLMRRRLVSVSSHVSSGTPLALQALLAIAAACCSQGWHCTITGPL